ncbi:MAG: exodeoxyribonuclease VII large subunit [Pseudomonadota bacterium]
MDDLLDDGGPAGNAPEFSVSDLTGAIKKTLEGAFGRVRVRGEIGRVIRASSGHFYYDLKDDRNVISCNTWKGQASGLGMVPEEGLEVIVTGKLSNYGPQSRYNLNVDTMELAGEGALMAMLERRRKALAAEGLFDQERKKPIPYLPRVIGVVTSPTGAVIRDILHRLRDRYPTKVLIWPVAVQGKGSAEQVARGIAGFNALDGSARLPRPDLLIVARGGGSLEDLMGFNDEAVVRAAAASDIPLISAVGHETDTTLIDYAADRRAPTPTAAAEMAVPVRLELLSAVATLGSRLGRAISAATGQRRQRLGDLARALPRPDALLETPRQRLDRQSDALGPALLRNVQIKRQTARDLSAALQPALERGIAAKRLQLGRATGRLSLGRLTDRVAMMRRDLARIDLTSGLARGIEARAKALANAARLLQSLGYKETLKRGYAVIRAEGRIVTETRTANKAARLEIEFADGEVSVSAGSAKRSGKPPKPGQGDLFGD